MKIKILALLLSITLSFGSLVQQSFADPTPLQGVRFPTEISYYNPSETTPLSANSDNTQDGMNSSFTFPEEANTFVFMTPSFLEIDPWDCMFDNPIVLTKHNAIENTTAENVITIPLGRILVVDLGETWVQASYDNKRGDYYFYNSWSFESDNQNMRDIADQSWQVAWLNAPKASKNKFSNGNLCQRFHIAVPFEASSLGETTISFTCKDLLHAEPKILTFRFNVIDASTPPIGSDIDASL